MATLRKKILWKFGERKSKVDANSFELNYEKKVSQVEKLTAISTQESWELKKKEKFLIFNHEKS